MSRQNDCHNETIVNFMTPPRKQLLLPSNLRVLGKLQRGARVVQCLLSRKQLQVFWKRPCHASLSTSGGRCVFPQGRQISKQETWGHLAVTGDQVFIRELKAIAAYRWR